MEYNKDNQAPGQNNPGPYQKNDSNRNNQGPYQKSDSSKFNNQTPYAPRKGGGGKAPAHKSSVRKKTETQSFLMSGEEKIETIFPVPVNVSLPAFQRSVGMAEGTIVEANEKGNGFVEIEGFKYPMKENRTPVMQKRYPLTKYVGKKIKFSFYPTITTKGIKILKLGPSAPPFIKISNFRKELPKQGAVEAIGTIMAIQNDHFTVSIWSGIAKKEYVVIIFGECKAKQGDLVKVDSVLKDGLIQMENMKILQGKR